MLIRKYPKVDIERIKSISVILDDNQYKKAITILSHSTIGKNVRHIYEFYFAAIKPQEGLICFDDRIRDTNVETNIAFAKNVFTKLLQDLKLIVQDMPIVLKANYEIAESQHLYFSSLLARELAYALEHRIHHQAMIKVDLDFLGDNLSLTKDFGVSKATQRHQISQSGEVSKMRTNQFCYPLHLLKKT